MRKRTFLVTLVPALALLVTGLPAAAEAGQGGSDRPFKGSAAGVVTGVTDTGALVIQYTGNATKRHRKKTFQEEVLEFLNKHGVEWDPQYVWE